MGEKIEWKHYLLQETAAPSQKADKKPSGSGATTASSANTVAQGSKDKSKTDQGGVGSPQESKKRRNESPTGASPEKKPKFEACSPSSSTYIPGARLVSFCLFLFILYICDQVRLYAPHLRKETINSIFLK